MSKLSWKLRRRAITRFSGSFADNFLAIVPELSEEEYDSLLLLGTTCMLEELEHEMPITEEDQAKCYLEVFTIIIEKWRMSFCSIIRE